MSNSQSQNRLPPSVRLRVNIVGQRLPVVFSYKELLKQHLRNQNSETAQHNQNPDIGLDEHDDFFRGLLERSMHYDPRDDEEDDGEDVDSEEEYLRVGSTRSRCRPCHTVSNQTFCSGKAKKR